MRLELTREGRKNILMEENLVSDGKQKVNVKGEKDEKSIYG